MKTRSLFALILLPAVLVGCATPAVKEEAPIFFPPAPSTPRIVYLRSIRGAADFQTVTIFDRIFGYSLLKTFGKPFDVFARGDRVYVSDTDRRVVYVVSMKEKRIETLGSSGSGKLKLPMGITGTPDGRTYVSDIDLKTIMVYDADGRYVQSIGKPGELTNPVSVAVNSALERLYVLDSKTHTVMVFSTKGDFLFQFGGGGDGDGMFLHPSFLTIDRRNDQVYVSDTNNFRVQVFDKDGTFIRKFGELGDAPGYFQRPKGIGIDSDGNAFVVEGFFNNFQIFDEQGRLLTWVGVGGRDSGGVFLSPSGLYIDDEDRVFVVDSINKRVQVFQYFSERWKKAHPEGFKGGTGPAGS